MSTPPKKHPWQKGRVTFQVYLRPDVRQALKEKTVSDRESMQSALQRLTEMYVAGQLPNAEPHQASQ